MHTLPDIGLYATCLISNLKTAGHQFLKEMERIVLPVNTEQPAFVNTP